MEFSFILAQVSLACHEPNLFQMTAIVALLAAAGIFTFVSGGGIVIIATTIV
jgi:hypothetical protein